MAPRQMRSNFPGRCTACRATFPAGTLILWAKGEGARHASVADCARGAADMAAAPLTVDHVAPRETFDAQPIATFLHAAQARGLKYPKARFVAPDGRSEMRLSVAGARSRAPGAVNVKIGDEWIGRVNVDGAVIGRGMDAPMLSTLATIAAAPAIAAKSYAALTSRCSFCNLALTDAGSVAVGYGPICAERYGLPHTAQGTPVLAAEQLATVPDGWTRIEGDDYDGTEDYNERARRDNARHARRTPLALDFEQTGHESLI